jgi:hypothetical protein
MSLSQKSVGFGKGFRKSGLKPAFSYKSKRAFPKTEVLGKAHIIENTINLKKLQCFLSEFKKPLTDAAFRMPYPQQRPLPGPLGPGQARA